MKQRPKVLFVCVENSCRSQMAEGLARSLGKDILEACSAGSQPSGVVSPDAIKAMREIRIDISRQQSKGFDVLPVKKFDYVIALGCKERCPFVPAAKHIDWNIADPKGKGITAFREVRDSIHMKILKLIHELGEQAEGKNGKAF